MNDRLYFSGLMHAKGALHMGLDEALLRADHGLPALRFYTWTPPCISLGRFQLPDAQGWEELQQLAATNGYDITRRTTGGGAIVHEAELTYSLVLPAGHPLTALREKLYATVHQVMAQVIGPQVAFASAQQSAAAEDDALMCFSRRSPFDLVGSQGGKLVGSAQRRRKGALLQHGSLKVAKQRAGGSAISASEIGEPVTEAELAQQLAPALADKLGLVLVPQDLSPQLEAEAWRFAEELFSSPAWIQQAQRRPHQE